MEAYFDATLETLPLPELHRLQLELLNRTLQRLYRREKHDYETSDRLARMLPISSVADLQGLPYTTATELKALYAATHCTPTVVFLSSGTTGLPRSVPYSEDDIQSAYRRTSRALTACGVTSEDRVALIIGFNAWFVGHDFLRATNQLKAVAVPLGEDTSDEIRALLIKDLEVTVVVSTPWVIARLTAHLLKHNQDPSEFRVRRLILTGEPLIDNMRHFLERIWTAEVFTIYGSSEADTLGTECQMHDGVHLWEDFFTIESVEAKGLAECYQELVITTLQREGYPLLRYRTGDIVQQLDGECLCGRTHRRIHVWGRLSEGMRLPSGAILFPFQFESILASRPEVIGYQLEIPSNPLREPFMLKVVANEVDPIPGAMEEQLREEASLVLEEILCHRPLLLVHRCDITQLRRGISGKAPRFLSEK